MTESKSLRASTDLPNQLDAVEQPVGPIEYRAIEILKAYASNPRKHPEKQLFQLTASIREFGFAFPVLVDENDTIIAGEARVTAARRIGMSKVPVIVAHHWSPAQVRAYRLADNRLAEHATWDKEALAIELAAIIEYDETPIEVLGWDTGEIDLILDELDAVESEKDPADEQIEPPVDPVSCTGDLWFLGKHRLLCCSSPVEGDWFSLLASEIAAMVFTDLPNNVNVSSPISALGKFRLGESGMALGNQSKSEFTTFLTGFIRMMTAHLKDGAVMDLCIHWRHMGKMLEAIEANGLTLLNLCAWNKNRSETDSLYRSKHELVFIAKKGTGPHTNNVELGRQGRYRTNVWDYAGVDSYGKSSRADPADHPCVKPVALVADAIRDVTMPDEIVLDAFMGSGTTILAAERTKRRSYGIEIAPANVDVAIRRWQAMTGLEATLERTGQTFAEVAADRGSDHNRRSIDPAPVSAD